MGGKYRVWWSGQDDIYNTADDSQRILYLESGAVLTYESLGDKEIRLEQVQEIDDNIIRVFHLQYATTAEIGATYQEQLEYYLLMGFDRATAVRKAQGSIGITKAEMILKLDEFQTEIIKSKQESIDRAELAIKTQTTTQDFTEINLTDIVNTIDITRTDKEAVGVDLTKPKTIDYIPSDTIFTPEIDPIKESVFNPQTDQQLVKQSIRDFRYEGDTIYSKIDYELSRQIPTTNAKHIFQVKDSKGATIKLVENVFTLKSKDTINANLRIGEKVDRNISVESYWWIGNVPISSVLKQSMSWTDGKNAPSPINKENLEKYQIPIIVTLGAGVIGGLMYYVKKKGVKN